MKFRYTMVCSSNQIRSMEAHYLLKRQGFDVSSYGTGTQVKLPGPTIREPNVYDFGTPYKKMLDDLHRKDPELYKRNGNLPMLKRNLSVKLARQDGKKMLLMAPLMWYLHLKKKFSIWLLKLLEKFADLHNRDHVLIINLEVKDNHEEAAVGARLTLDLCQKTEAAEESIDDIIAGFEKQHRRKLLYSISFY